MEDMIHTKAKRPEAQNEVVTSCQEIAGGYESHVMFQLIILEGKLDGRVKTPLSKTYFRFTSIPLLIYI